VIDVPDEIVMANETLRLSDDVTVLANRVVITHYKGLSENSVKTLRVSHYVG
jgi:hypothetical protein